jgi:hypothetical protein
MEDAKKVADAIASGKGFKKYFKGGFGKKAKLAQELWERASQTAVAPAVLVAEFGDTGVAKSVYAFATDGQAVPENVQAKLRDKAEDLTDGQIKTDDRGYVGLSPLRPPVGSSPNPKGKLTFNVADLANGADGVKTFYHSTVFFDASDAAASKSTVVLYAQIDGEDYIYPISTGRI